MTPAEVITLREIIKESYPYAKMNNDRGDDVWFMLLKDYEFKPINDALINHIQQGNKFAPSIAELIGMYNTFYKQQASAVINEMDRDGYFNDPPETNAEIALWNHKNRISKAIKWTESNFMPEWFKRDYQKYYNRLYSNRIDTRKAKLLT